MSNWGKFLAPVTVPSGWNISLSTSGSAYSTSLTAGTYSTMLHVVAELQTRIQTDIGIGTWSSTIASNGITTIGFDDDWSITWSKTSTALATALGYDKTEAVDATHDLDSSLPHTHGWYPGVLSRDRSRGEPTADDSEWWPDDQARRTISGSRKAHLNAPPRPHYYRKLAWTLISREELLHRTSGVICLMDRWGDNTLWWYPNADDGAVGDYGTQGDPGIASYHNDDDCDYYKVALTGAPNRARNPRHHDWYRVEVELSAEPA